MVRGTIEAPHFFGILVGLLWVACTTAPTSARDLSAECVRAKFRVGKTEFHAYLADDAKKREVGLMYIDALPTDVGMLFVFEREQTLSFWMKNTQIPLAIGFFDRDAVMVDAQEMVVASSVLARLPPTYPSRKPARFALEMNKGCIARHGAKVGDRLCRVGATPSSATNDAVPPCP